VPDQSDRVQILMIEDNPTDAELCLRSLENHDLAGNVVWLRDGAEALDYLLLRGPHAGRNPAETPTVVLLDLHLPKVDGKEVLKQIKTDGRLKTVPVVMLTSSHDEHDIRECYRLGANSFVIKPVGFDSFTDTVARLGYYWSSINTPRRHEPT
jgi:two-component system, response regulator